MNNESTNRIGTIEKSSILKPDSNIIFLQKKSERISVAIYLITNFFNADEPLKRALREDALALIKDMNALSRGSLADRESVVHTGATHIGQINSLIELARTAGFISPMNADILVSELAILLMRLEDRQSQELPLSSVSFDRVFFEVKAPEVRNTFGQVSPMSDIRVQAKPYESNGMPVADKGHYKGHMKNNVLYNTPHAKSDRQESILKALGKGEYMNIKDLLKHVKDCSEKTLQRELTTLLQKGVVKRTGERRWSTYSLAKS